MNYLEPYVFFNKISYKNKEEVIKYFENLAEKSSKYDSITDFEYSMDEISFNYINMFPFVDLVYDDSKDQIVSEHSMKIEKTEVYIYFESDIMLIWGRPQQQKKLQKVLGDFNDLSFIPLNLTIDEITKGFNSFDYIIKSISFNQLKLFDTPIAGATFEVKANRDAYLIIKKLKVDVSKIELDLVLPQNDLINISFDLEFGKGKIFYDKISIPNIERIKETINRLAGEIIV